VTSPDVVVFSDAGMFLMMQHMYVLRKKKLPMRRPPLRKKTKLSWLTILLLWWSRQLSAIIVCSETLE